MLDLFGYFGYGSIFLGQYLLTKKIAHGWILRIIGDLIWLSIGIQMGMSSIVVGSVVGILIDTIGAFRWKN